MLLLNGISMGMFASPNRAAVMNSLPRGDRGAGGGMNQTFQNSAQVLSIGVFFTLMIIGLSSKLPATMLAGLEAHGVAGGHRQQRRASAARLDPVRGLPRLQPDRSTCSGLTRWPRSRRTTARRSSARSFFPHLISAPFRSGLHEAFAFAIIACLIAAAASLMRGGRYHAGDLAGSRHGNANPDRHAPAPGAPVARAGTNVLQEAGPHLAGPAVQAITREEQHAH